MEAFDGIPWTTLSVSVCGAGHVREETANQDAIEAADADDGTFAVIAVADGHGDISHLRSAHGARFAVRALVDQIVADRSRLIEADVASREAVLRDVFNSVLHIWRRRVLNDRLARPIVAEEYVARGLAPEPASAAAANANRQDGLVLYGSTLLAVAVWQSGGIALRLGDGNVVALPSALATPARALFTDDFGDTTQSLCDDDVLDVVEYITLVTEGIEAIAITTDGYTKSFRRFEDFLANMRWVVDQLAGPGRDSPHQWLSEWLEQVSRDGSEDDVTFGLLTPSKVAPRGTTHTRDPETP